MPCHPEVALGSGWRCGAVAILDRCAVPRCGAVRILCSQWAGVVMRWPFWIVTWSFAAALCQFLHAKCASRGCGVFATNHRQFLFFGALLEEHVEAVRRRHIWCTVEADLRQKTRSIITCNPPFNAWTCVWMILFWEESNLAGIFFNGQLGDEDLAQNVKAWLDLG